MNPLGVIYNPVSLFKTLRISLEPQIDHHRIIEADQIFYHWDTHSIISADSRDNLIANFNEQLHHTNAFLSKVSTIVISLGTSWVYRHQSGAEIVANCHKVPQKEFSKALLTVHEIVDDYLKTLDLLRTNNPDLNVILTVSPVRHIRDGLVENNLSKSILIQAVQEIVTQDPKASYFPSYEILIDVLRDYRFYKEDMIHPNDQAVDYIWRKFSLSYLDENAQVFILEWEKIARALQHRPFHPHSPAHQSFIKSTLSKLQSLADKVDVEKELKALKNQLIDT